jgi:hypothetical protein
MGTGLVLVAYSRPSVVALVVRNRQAETVGQTAVGPVETRPRVKRVAVDSLNKEVSVAVTVPGLVVVTVVPVAVAHLLPGLSPTEPL